MEMGGGWVLELDIRAYFDTIDHGQLRAMVQQRVKDGVINRLIGKWLKAGIMEKGAWSRPESGSPQGGVISSLLSNIYLHHVLDEWFTRDVQPRLIGRSFMLRYADDATLVFTNEHDARRVQAVLGKRFARFGLSLHPTKTRLVPFYPPGRGQDSGSFDLLGFTHYWAKSRQGRWTVKCKTAKDRFRRAVKSIAQWCRSNRHRPSVEQLATLARKLKGLYNLDSNSKCNTLTDLRCCTWSLSLRSYLEIAEHLGVHYSAVNQAVKALESFRRKVCSYRGEIRCSQPATGNRQPATVPPQSSPAIAPNCLIH